MWLRSGVAMAVATIPLIGPLAWNSRMLWVRGKKKKKKRQEGTVSFPSDREVAQSGGTYQLDEAVV